MDEEDIPNDGARGGLLDQTKQKERHQHFSHGTTVFLSRVGKIVKSVGSSKCVVTYISDLSSGSRHSAVGRGFNMFLTSHVYFLVGGVESL